MICNFVGFVTGSADKTAKFWNFSLQPGGLSATVDRQLVLPSDVLSVRYNAARSQNHLMVATALLDNTVRVFYEDSCKLFLTLYGHKLPVMCLDISYDSQVLVSGSADKTLKLWGLDFGDCHRSMIAHEDSVTCVRFQPQTHFFFSAGKDGTIKYWDADRYEQVSF
jgi:U3 small nucleolar RNA-associated protein 12